MDDLGVLVQPAQQEMPAETVWGSLHSGFFHVFDAPPRTFFPWKKNMCTHVGGTYSQYPLAILMYCTVSILHSVPWQTRSALSSTWSAKLHESGGPLQSALKSCEPSGAMYNSALECLKPRNLYCAPFARKARSGKSLHKGYPSPRNPPSKSGLGYLSWSQAFICIGSILFWLPLAFSMLARSNCSSKPVKTRAKFMMCSLL